MPLRGPDLSLVSFAILKFAGPPCFLTYCRIEKHGVGETSDGINYMLSFVKVGEFVKECSLKIPLIRFLFRIHFVFHVIYPQNT